MFDMVKSKTLVTALALWQLAISSVSEMLELAARNSIWFSRLERKR